MPTARSASSCRSAARSTTRSPSSPTGSATSPADPHQGSAALANVASTGLSTDVCPVLSVRYQPLCPHCCPQVVDNSGDGQDYLQEPGLGTVRGQPVDDTPSSVDNRRISGPDLWTAHHRPQQACFVHVHRPRVIHRFTCRVTCNNSGCPHDPQALLPVSYTHLRAHETD